MRYVGSLKNMWKIQRSLVRVLRSLSKSLLHWNTLWESMLYTRFETTFVKYYTCVVSAFCREEWLIGHIRWVNNNYTTRRYFYWWFDRLCGMPSGDCLPNCARKHDLSRCLGVWSTISRVCKFWYCMHPESISLIYDLLISTKVDWTYYLQKLQPTINKMKEKGLNCNIENRNGILGFLGSKK